MFLNLSADDFKARNFLFNAYRTFLVMRATDKELFILFWYLLKRYRYLRISLHVPQIGQNNETPEFGVT